MVARADRAGGLLMYGIPSMKLDKIEKVLRRIKLLQQDAEQYLYDVYGVYMQNSGTHHIFIGYIY